MDTVSFDVQLPDKYYEFSITKYHNKCTIIEPIESADETGITKTITPNQLVYVVKEFNLLNRFRRRIFNLLKRLGSATVLFHVIEPINGGLIDYAWYVFFLFYLLESSLRDSIDTLTAIFAKNYF